MDEIIPALNRSKYVKTYLTKAERHSEAPNTNLPTLPNLVRKPLTTKDAVKLLLEGNLSAKVCRYCLNIASPLSELDQILEVANKGAFYKVTIRDMIASFHPFKVENDPSFPDKICEKCLDRTISSYFFTQQCEQAERALRNCFEDMYEKLDKLDPLGQTRKRGRQKRNPNYNILHAEHENVIDYADPIIHIVNRASEPMTEQNEINELECLKCCEVLPNLESLLNHAKIHPKSMWYNCRLCGRSFPKLHLLKRHFRSAHKSKTPQKPLAEVAKYDCKRCGFTSERYYDYLQHIEKHKFKTVMNHLFEKKMDRLCSICLNKEVNMVPLNRMVCLHGGSPELTGDRSLYTILASTLREKKNKYQELYVPTQASVMQIIKKKKKNECQHATDFPFSNPIVLTVEELSCDDFYLFFFSEPEMLNSVKDNAEVQMVEDTENNDISCNSAIPEMIASEPESEENDIEHVENISKTNIDVQCYSEIMGKPDSINIFQDNQFSGTTSDIKISEPESPEKLVKFTFSNPDFVNFENNKIIIPRKLGLSEESLISDQPNQEHNDKVKPVVIMLDEDIQNITVNVDTKPCNYCWVFKHLSKCEWCKKLNAHHNNTNTSDTSKSTVDANPFDSNSIINYFTAKVGNEETCKSKEPWECKICLINNNKDREICDCCEAPLSNIENNIFKFNSIDYKVESTPNDCVDAMAHGVDRVACDPPSSLTNDKIYHLYASNTANVVFNSQSQEISLMETETIEAENPANITDSIANEAMDIEEMQIPETRCFFPNIESNIPADVFNEMIPNITSDAINMPPLTLNNSFTSNQFQFAIGSGDKSSRQYKRAARRKPRAFHK